MRILFLSHALDPSFGGAPISEASLAEALSQSSSVKVIVRKQFHRKDFSAKYHLDVTEYHPIDFLLAWLFLGSWAHKHLNRVDVVHLNGYWRWELFFLARLCIRKHIPYVLHPRGMLLVFHRKILLKKLFNFLIGNWIVRNAHRVIALSHFEVRHFQGYPIAQERIVVQPNGITPPLGSAKGASGFGIGKYLLYLGRIEKRKNLEFLLDAFSRVEVSGIELKLVGPVEHGYDKIVRERAMALGISSNVKVMAPLYGDEKWQLISDAQAVIYPSTEEAFGRVPFEAIVGGSQPVLPEQSGGSEYLKKFIPENIYLGGDVDSLTKTLKTVLRSQPKRLAQAREWIEKDLRWENIARRVEGIYRAI